MNFIKIEKQLILTLILGKKKILIVNSNKKLKNPLRA